MMKWGIDMSENNKEISKNADAYGDYSVMRVPNENRRSFMSMFFVFNGVVICAAALWAGSALATGLNLVDSIIACLAGFAIAAIVGGFVASIGAREGVSSTMLSRHTFGRYGAIIVGLIFAITNWGWYAFQAGFFGDVINTMFPGHFLTQPNVAAFWGGCLMIITAMIGYKGLAFLSFLSIPLMLVIIAAGDAAIISNVGLDKILAAVPSNPITLAQGITIAAGGMGVGCVISADVSRYAKKGSHGFWSFLLAIVLVNNFVVISGSAITLATGTPNLPQAMVAAGLGVSSLVMLILAQWTTNDNNLYSTTLALINLIPVKKWILALVLGILASIAAAMGIVDSFVPFLTFLGTYIPPIGGIIMADYFLIRPMVYKKTGEYRYDFGYGTEYDGVDVIAVILIILSGYIGSKIPGIAAINAIIVGFVGYFILAYGCSKMGIKYRFGKKKESDTGY